MHTIQSNEPILKQSYLELNNNQLVQSLNRSIDRPLDLLLNDQLNMNLVGSLYDQSVVTGTLEDNTYDFESYEIL